MLYSSCYCSITICTSFTTRKLLLSGIRFSAPCYNFHNTRFSQGLAGSQVITPGRLILVQPIHRLSFSNSFRVVTLQMTT